MAKPSTREWTKIDKGMASFYFFLHVLCIFAPFYFDWSAFWVAFALHHITGLFGISVSYHRNLSHRSFNLPKFLEYLLAYCGVHALQVWCLPTYPFAIIVNTLYYYGWIAWHMKIYIYYLTKSFISFFFYGF